MTGSISAGSAGVITPRSVFKRFILVGVVTKVSLINVSNRVVREGGENKVGGRRRSSRWPLKCIWSSAADENVAVHLGQACLRVFAG